MEKKTPLGLKVLAVLGALVVVPGGAFLAIASIGTGGKVAIAAGVIWWLVASAVIGKTLLKREPDLRTPVRATLAVAAVAALVTTFVVTRGNTVDEDIVTAAPTAQASSAAERDAALAAEAEIETEAAEKPKPAKKKAAKKPAATKKKPSATKATKAQPEPKPDPEPAKKAPAQNVQLLSGSFNGESGHRGKGKAAVVKLAKGGRVVTFSSFDVDPGAGDLRVYLHEGKSSSDDLGKFVEVAKLKGNKGDQQYEIPGNVDLKRFDTVVIWCVPFSTRIAQAPLN